MKSVGQIVRNRREAMGLTLAGLAEAVGATKGYLSMIENERVSNPPSTQVLAALEQALGITDGELRRAADWQNTPAPVRQQFEHVAEAARRGADLARWLKGATTPRRDGARNLDKLYRTGQLARRVNQLLRANDAEEDAGEEAGGRGGSRSSRSGAAGIDAAVPVRYQVPVINRVAAGYPTDFSDLDFPRRVADEYVAAPDVTDPDAFAARVVGDSMEPEYRAGDIVVFSPSADVSAGHDCFVRLEPDHETTFKRVFFEGEDGAVIRLQPLNPKYPPQQVPREQVAGLYRAVWRFTPLA